MSLNEIMTILVLGLAPVGAFAQNIVETEVSCSGRDNHVDFDIRVFRLQAGTDVHHVEMSSCELEFGNSDRYECQSERHGSYAYMHKTADSENRLVYEDGESKLKIDTAQKDKYGFYRGVYVEHGREKFRLFCCR